MGFLRFVNPFLLSGRGTFLIRRNRPLMIQSQPLVKYSQFFLQYLQVLPWAELSSKMGGILQICKVLLLGSFQIRSMCYMQCKAGGLGGSTPKDWPNHGATLRALYHVETKLVSLRDDTTQQMDGCWVGKGKVDVGVVNKKRMDGGSQRVSG